MLNLIFEIQSFTRNHQTRFCNKMRCFRQIGMVAPQVQGFGKGTHRGHRRRGTSASASLHLPCWTPSCMQSAPFSTTSFIRRRVGVSFAKQVLHNHPCFLFTSNGSSLRRRTEARLSITSKLQKNRRKMRRHNFVFSFEFDP